MDDITLTEMLSLNQPSSMEVFLNELCLINEQKTRDMIITSFFVTCPVHTKTDGW